MATRAREKANNDGVIRLYTADEAPEVDREPLFYIDDEMFGVPTEVPPTISLQFLEDMRDADADTGMAKAVANAFNGLLGDDALGRLAKCKKLKNSEMQQIMAAVQQKMLAATEGLTGN